MVETFILISTLFFIGGIIFSAIKGVGEKFSSANYRRDEIRYYKVKNMVSENGKHYVLQVYQKEFTFIYWATILNGYTNKTEEVQASSLENLENCIQEKYRRFELRDKRDE